MPRDNIMHPLSDYFARFMMKNGHKIGRKFFLEFFEYIKREKNIDLLPEWDLFWDANETAKSESEDKQKKVTSIKYEDDIEEISLTDLVNTDDKMHKKKYTVAVLKTLCSQRGLPKTGNRASLLDALIKYESKNSDDVVISDNPLMDAENKKNKIVVKNKNGQLHTCIPELDYQFVLEKRNDDFWVIGWAEDDDETIFEELDLEKYETAEKYKLYVDQKCFVE